ncbi:hypothetical protein [Alkalihalobacillus sp. LMS39]|uniref:hypothetical protein n=1 Tax=Alkalihalobacillus sp. LMS39 TaxID=2924032 RepID=UPI001FB2FDDA|nr:hypothetical protein [Alkalihalobacillus sp. LMS39]UOE92011.1 hypothetical protein MM271_12090 [Alkalihalobacillus sp. LMS39]
MYNNKCKCGNQTQAPVGMAGTKQGPLGKQPMKQPYSTNSPQHFGHQQMMDHHDMLGMEMHQMGYPMAQPMHPFMGHQQIPYGHMGAMMPQQAPFAQQQMQMPMHQQMGPAQQPMTPFAPQSQMAHQMPQQHVAGNMHQQLAGHHAPMHQSQMMGNQLPKSHSGTPTPHTMSHGVDTGFSFPEEQFGTGQGYFGPNF